MKDYPKHVVFIAKLIEKATGIPVLKILQVGSIIALAIATWNSEKEQPETPKPRIESKDKSLFPDGPRDERLLPPLPPHYGGENAALKNWRNRNKSFVTNRQKYIHDYVSLERAILNIPLSNGSNSNYRKSNERSWLHSDSFSNRRGIGHALYCPTE